MSTKLLKLEDKGAGGGEAGQGLLGTVQEEGFALFLLFVFLEACMCPPHTHRQTDRDTQKHAHKHILVYTHSGRHTYTQTQEKTHKQT